MSARRFLLVHRRAPGDVTCMTALPRDIKAKYGDSVQVDVFTRHDDLWRNNPHLTKLFTPEPSTLASALNGKAPRLHHSDTTIVEVGYGPGIRRQNHETVHFLPWFHRDFNKRTGLEIVPTRPYGDLHLTPADVGPRPLEHRYWVLMGGGKSDFTIKVWRPQLFGEVVAGLREAGLAVMQCGSTADGNWNPRIPGVVDRVGQAERLSELLRLIHHAEGVICGVTAAMHIAAAMQKPCVVIAGGREAWWWEAYTRENKGLPGSETLAMPHRYLHTIGLLACCMRHGCWRNKVVPTNGDRNVCYHPITNTPDIPVAKCMEMIRPQHVLEAVMSHYEDRSLPPITPLGDVPEEPSPTPRVERVVQKPPPVKPIRGAKAPSTHTKATVRVPMQTLAKWAAAKAQAAPAAVPPEAVFDHPDVGGRLTVFALLYGGEEHHALHARFLKHLLETLPPSRTELRLGSNALNAKSLALVEQHVASGRIVKHYRHGLNDYKYPVMREMFHDPAMPIETKWLLWFDDDSICDVDTDWCVKLAQHIAQRHRPQNAHMFGANFIWSPNPAQRRILESRPWHRGRPWRNQQGVGAPNGNKIHFCTGGFWALTTEAMRAADIPDLGTGLTHNGGDWQIGEQLYQAGFAMSQFNGKKQFVRTSGVPRRGVTMPLIDGTMGAPPRQRS